MRNSSKEILNALEDYTRGISVGDNVGYLGQGLKIRPIKEKVKKDG